jgi:ribosomal protein S18 acetylase RimI-like enzyme
MVFKEAHIGDIDTILSILNKMANDLKAKKINQWTQWLSPQSLDIKWINDKILSQSFFFVFIDDEMAGMFSLSNSDEKYWGPQIIKAKYLHSLTTLPNFKGQGLAKKVIAKIKSDLVNSDFKYIRLDCISTNTHLIDYYQSQGFVYFKTTLINSNRFLLHQFEL